MNLKKISKIAMTGVAAASLVGLSTQAFAGAHKNMEKCYGVVKAGKNDCGVAGKHSCAGQAKTNAGSDEWVMVPTGLCDKLEGGSITAVKATAKPAAEGDS